MDGEDADDKSNDYKKLRVFNQRLNKRLSGGQSGDISKGYISEYPSTGECRRDCEIAIVRSAIVDDDAAIFPALSSVEIQSTTKEQVQPAIDRTSFDMVPRLVLNTEQSAPI